MRGIKTPETNLEIKVGQSGADRSLWVYGIYNEQGMKGYCAVFEPTLEERALLAKGHNVELHVYCGDWPFTVFPTAMAVSDEGMGAMLPEVRVNEQMRIALARACSENDYCYVCDNHPSHGHDPECPMKERP